jgi:hypothetical protein
MLGLSQPVQPKDFIFERQVCLFFDEVYKNNSDDDYFFAGKMPNGMPGFLRVSIYGEGVDSCPAVVEASRKAKKAYDMWVDKLDAEYTLYKALNPLIPHTEEANKMERKRDYLDSYRSMSVRYCFALKHCIPMYAAHHMDNEIRQDGGFGGFYCPLSYVADHWYKSDCGLEVDAFSRPFEAEIWPGHDDYCNHGCDHEYEEFNQLLAHLEAKQGPMHQAAAAYLRCVYYNRIDPVEPGSYIYDVEINKMVIRKRNGSDFVVIKPEITDEERDTNDDGNGSSGSSEEEDMSTTEE